MIYSKCDTVSHYATRCQNTYILCRLFKEDSIKVNVQNKNCFIPLHAVAMYDKFFAFEELLKTDADFNLKNKDGAKPVDLFLDENRASHALTQIENIINYKNGVVGELGMGILS